jgi:hypothetical protein
MAPNQVDLSGQVSGSLSSPTPLCGNQYPGVQTAGMLGGHWYQVQAIDPTAATYAQSTGGYVNVTEWSGDPRNPTASTSILASWVGGVSTDVTNYDAQKGATFKAHLTPESGMSPQGATASLDVSGSITC